MTKPTSRWLVFLKLFGKEWRLLTPVVSKNAELLIELVNSLRRTAVEWRITFLRKIVLATTPPSHVVNEVENDREALTFLRETLEHPAFQPKPPSASAEDVVDVATPPPVMLDMPALRSPQRKLVPRQARKERVPTVRVRATLTDVISELIKGDLEITKDAEARYYHRVERVLETTSPSEKLASLNQLLDNIEALFTSTGANFDQAMMVRLNVGKRILEAHPHPSFFLEALCERVSSPHFRMPALVWHGYVGLPLVLYFIRILVRRTFYFDFRLNEANILSRITRKDSTDFPSAQELGDFVRPFIES